MHLALPALPALILLLLTTPASAAPSDPALAAELCMVALKNRPVDQLQARSTCEVVQTKAYPKGSPVKRALVVRVPLNHATVDLLMFEVAPRGKSAWVDLGEVAGDHDDSGLRRQWTLERLELRTTRIGPVLEVAMNRVQETDDKTGVIEARTHDLMVCHYGADLVCVAAIDRNAVAVRGNIPDIKPYSWTREVTLDAAGDLVVGDRTGTGDLPGFDIASGKHTIASLADRPFVRRYPIVSTVHPDAVKDDLGVPDLP